MTSKSFVILSIFFTITLLINAVNGDSPGNKLLDTITGATTIENELQLIKNISENKEKIDKKEFADSKIKFIEIPDDATSDFRRYDNTKKTSSMILFNENNKTQIPSLNEEFEEALESKKKSQYKSNDFIPGGINDFYKSNPAYIYKVNIIQPGKNKISESLGESIFFIAYKYFKANNTKNAKILFEKLINYNHRIIDSYYYLSWCSYINKDFITSIDYMNEAIIKAEINNWPDNTISNYYYQIGNFYYKLDDHSNSIIYFFKSLQKNSQNFECYNRLGISYYLMGNPIKALEMWKLGMNGKDQDSTINYNWLYKKLKY